MPGRPMDDSPTHSHGEFGEREVCDDPSTSLTVPCPLALDELEGEEDIAALLGLTPAAVEQTDSGPAPGEVSDESPERVPTLSPSPVGEDEIAEDWNPSLYMLQSQAPKSKCVLCNAQMSGKPPQYGLEYHGLMARSEAASLLGCEDGRFLVRENPLGNIILSFMLDGRMWNYQLFYEDSAHFVGDKRFDSLEELVEDGLITLFMMKHDVGLEMQKGRAVTRKRTMKLKRQPGRRIKNPRRFKKSVSSPDTTSPPADSKPPSGSYRRPIYIPPNFSSSPPRLDETEEAPPQRSTSLEPRSHLSSTSSSSSEEGSASVPLTPKSNEFQSDLDFCTRPPRLVTQRRSTPNITRQHAMATGAHTMADKRAKSTESLPNKQNGKSRYGAVFALRDSVRAENRARSMEVVEVNNPQKKKASTMIAERSRPKSWGSKGRHQLMQRPKSYHSPSTEKLKDLQEKVEGGESPYWYYKAHKFQIHTYKAPTWCQLCHHFLWGLKHQGMQCPDCGMDVHTQCVVVAMKHQCKPTKKMIKKVFGVGLTTLLKLEGGVIPTAVSQCLTEIESRDMDCEGIYRVSGHATEILELKEKYDMGEPVDFSQYEDINIITGAVKLFLRDLPIPLVTFDSYSAIMKATASIDDPNSPTTDWQMLSSAIKLLPKAHYTVLKHLAEHLHRVEQQSEMNKMTAYNLAVVFAPTLMRSPANELALIKDFPLQRQFIEYVILYHHKLFDA